MKRITALLLALALIFALAGCIRSGVGDDPDADNPGPGTQVDNNDDDHGNGDPDGPGDVPDDDKDKPNGEDKPPVQDPDDAPDDPGDSDDDPDTPPDQPDTGTLAIGFMDDAASLAAAGLYGGEFKLVTKVADPGEGLRSGDLDAAVVPVDMAARIYTDTGRKIKLAAVVASGGWGIVERGSSVRDMFGLAQKTVYVPKEEPGAAEVFAYIAEGYGFEIGDTLKIEYVPKAELSEHELSLMPSSLAGTTIVQDAGTHMALKMADGWREVSGCSFLPAACLVVSTDMENSDLDALKAAFKVSTTKESVSENMDDVLSMKLAGSDEEAWAYLECLDFIWIDGANDLREQLADYFSVLYEIDQELIGGSIPDDGFYS